MLLALDHQHIHYKVCTYDINSPKLLRDPILYITASHAITKNMLPITAFINAKGYSTSSLTKAPLCWFKMSVEMWDFNSHGISCKLLTAPPSHIFEWSSYIIELFDRSGIPFPVSNVEIFHVSNDN